MKATKLDGTDKIIQLLECCDHWDDRRPSVRSLAVREENTMVASDLAQHEAGQG